MAESPKSQTRHKLRRSVVSRYEESFLLILIHFAPDLPKPRRQYCFAREAVGDLPHPPARAGMRQRLKKVGLQDWRFDFAWPEAKLAVEIDGGQFAPSGGRHNSDEDRAKLNAAAEFGWRVLRYSPAMLRDPQAVVEQIRRSL